MEQTIYGTRKNKKQFMDQIIYRTRKITKNDLWNKRFMEQTK